LRVVKWRWSDASVVLPKAAESFLEEFLVGVQLVLEERLPERLHDLPVAGKGVLPAGAI
jgi:hypothetical protein